MDSHANQIHAVNYTIYTGKDSLHRLDQFLKERYRGRKKFILVDENTEQHCLPMLRANEVDELEGAQLIRIRSGEVNKNLETCQQIWGSLMQHGADRNSVLINLGGGVICDMGGFAAATFKRGIDFIHVPTTLLAQIDASVGGKLGIDFNSLKNQIGLFKEPRAVFVYSYFLNTQTERQRRSGFAEGVKHALIWEDIIWETIQSYDMDDARAWPGRIALAIKIKNQIVSRDPHENGLRKILNFGHTIGHALETYALQSNALPLSHGEAVAIGLMCETYLSHKVLELPIADLDHITNFLKTHFPYYAIESFDLPRLMEIMETDKKNFGGGINFTLLKEVGNAKIDQSASKQLIKESLDYYTAQFSS